MGIETHPKNQDFQESIFVMFCFLCFLFSIYFLSRYEFVPVRCAFGCGVDANANAKLSVVA